jgi:NADH-quinone oxidoreductase subunit F
VRIGRDETVGNLLHNGFDAVYLGIGAMEGVRLGVPGDDLPGNLLALDFLRDHHRGDAIDVRGKRALVVGGGDAALDAARTLVRLGAASVRIVYRRSREEMPAHAEEVAAAEQEGVTLHIHMAPVRVDGTGKVESMKAVRTEPGEPDRSGRRRPVNVPGTEIDIETDLVVSAAGQRPDLSCIELELDLERDGSVRVDSETCATSVPGLFAGGDLTAGWKTVVNAIADGRRAAFGIDLHLAGEGRTVHPVEFVDPSTLSFFEPRNLQPEPGHRAQMRPAEERRRDHRDVVMPMTEEEAREEAARCLLCAMCSSCSACTDLFGCPAFREEDGRVVIDETLCSGCGVCVSFCPNGAIHEVTD